MERQAGRIARTAGMSLPRSVNVNKKVTVAFSQQFVKIGVRQNQHFSVYKVREQEGKKTGLTISSSAFDAAHICLDPRSLAEKPTTLAMNLRLRLCICPCTWQLPGCLTALEGPSSSLEHVRVLHESKAQQ